MKTPDNPVLPLWRIPDWLRILIGLPLGFVGGLITIGLGFFVLAYVLFRAAIQSKFQGACKPQLIPDKALTPYADDFVAYALLCKHLSFSNAFERLDEFLKFKEIPVSAFGFERHKEGVDKNLFKFE